MNSLTEDTVRSLARLAIESGENQVSVEIAGHKVTVHALDNTNDVALPRPVLEALLLN